jgi:hypothetical protein
LLAAGVFWSASESGLGAPVVNPLSAQPGSVDLSFDFGKGAYSRRTEGTLRQQHETNNSLAI